MKKFIIEVENLDYRYSSQTPWILKNINFKLEEGHFLSIIGPNGAGKSTLLKVMLGILKREQGAIKLFGIDIDKLNKKKYSIGYVPQFHNLPSHFPLSVFDVVMMGQYAQIGLFHFPTKKNKENTILNLQKVGMLDFINEPFQSLSGGQKQRVLIARALSTNSKLLILDEPEAGIDTMAKNDFYDLLERLKKEENCTIVMVTHEIDIVPKISDEVICLDVEMHWHERPEDAFKCPIIQKSMLGSKLELIIHGNNIPHRLVSNHDANEQNKKNKGK